MDALGNLEQNVKQCCQKANAKGEVEGARTAGGQLRPYAMQHVESWNLQLTYALHPDSTRFNLPLTPTFEIIKVVSARLIKIRDEFI